MTITITTDFGNADGFVGIMKGVILSLAPQATIVDISNEIAPGDIASAAWVLANSYEYFPPGSVHLAVVDPGVGSSRRGIVVRSRAHTFVAPDNGLLTCVLQHAGPVDSIYLNESSFWRQPVSSTFHGRDVFAPIAAHLALGRDLSELGSPVDFEDLVRLPGASLRVERGTVSGAVVYVDRYGNLITNIPASTLATTKSCSVNGHVVGVGVTYSSVTNGLPLALPGSHASVEVAVNGGRADVALNARIGTVVTLVLD